MALGSTQPLTEISFIYIYVFICLFIYPRRSLHFNLIISFVFFINLFIEVAFILFVSYSYSALIRPPAFNNSFQTQ
jgi:hypothetical protein